jgi:hypothetical protein
MNTHFDSLGKKLRTRMLQEAGEAFSIEKEKIGGQRVTLVNSSCRGKDLRDMTINLNQELQ